MSIPFSNTTTKNGLIQIVERTCGFNDGDISGNATLLAQVTGDINLTIDEMLGFMFPLGGEWQIDDSNQTSYPIITTNIVSGQKDYTFTTDHDGNTILDIYKVMAVDASGTFRELNPVDQESITHTGVDMTSFVNGQNVSGVPNRYDKTGNGIFLDPVPNYNYTNGLKVFINREATYFASTDTTKKLGFAHLFHEYLALCASHRLATRRSLSVAGGILKNGARTGLLGDIYEMKQAIKNYFGTRSKDVSKRIRPAVHSSK